MHDVRRKRIDHLVGDHGAVEARGQLLDMLDAIAELFLLPANEVGAGFQDQVFPTVGQHVGERAAAGADLEDAIERAQLARERTAEERAELGCGDEVAARAELARAARVVADARLVQRELHVARERDPAAAGGDLCLDALARLHALESKALMSDSLAGRAVLVTRCAPRLGAAIARRLHGAGASVLIHYRDSDADAAKLEAELNAARPKSAGKVKAELLAPIAPRALVAAALDSFGRLDVLVNNASAFFPVGVGEIELSHWEELIGSNLRAPLFISQEAAPELAKQAGAVINIVDIHAERPLQGYPVYSIAKAGPAATPPPPPAGLAPHGRVDGVAPGAIAWPDDGQFDPAERGRIVASTPLGRVGRPRTSR